MALSCLPDAGDDRRAEYVVSKSATGGEQLVYYIEMVRAAPSFVRR